MRKLYFTLAVVIFTVEFSGKAIGQSVDSYDPIRFGMPEAIGGYPVLAVLTEENFACMKSGEKRLVLQSPQPTIEDGPRDFPKELIEQKLQELNLAEYKLWGLEVVGPGVTREQLVRQFEQSYRFFKVHGCPTLDLPTAGDECSLLAGGELRCKLPGQGYAIIQNLDADKYPDNNGQSVILIAPTVGNNQQGWNKCDITLIPCPIQYKGYSAFLNNGVTDKGYFLQVGLYFTNRKENGGNIPEIPPGCVTLNDPGNPFSPEGIGLVVWARAKIEEGKAKPPARPLCVPYTSGHHYYTTIAYTSGTWWTCAADMQDTATYRCHEHKDATEIGSTHLINRRAGTNVFTENWNENGGWVSGFPYQWVAYEAKTYVGGIGYPWSLEAKWTQHSCKDKNWPPNEAIVSSSGLVNDGVNNGYAFFNTAYLPLLL